MATRSGKPRAKKVVTPAFKREIEKARRDLAAGKGIAVAELLKKVLERSARKHAGRSAAITAFIAAFLTLHVVLAVSCYFRRARTWGWQMFAHGTIYRAEIFASDETGARLVPVEAELLRAVLSPRTYDFFAPAQEPKDFHRGRGLLAEAAAQIPAGLCRRAPGDRPAAFVLRLEHRDVGEPAMSVDVFRAACR